MSNLTLSAMHIYPVKSMGGIAVEAAQIEQRGFQYDRRWMLVDENGTLLTQRQYPKMALISMTIEADGLSVSAASMDDLFIPFDMDNPMPVIVRVWRSVCQAHSAEQTVNDWFTQFLGVACRLVYMPNETRRAVNPDYALDHNSIVSFADGYPFMLLGEASLADLNQRLATPLPMNRFRPNLVVSGSLPYAEDNWGEIRIGSTLFHGVKPCDRCVVTTIDQATGEQGVEPLKTLATYRQVDHQVLFGRYLIPEQLGVIQIGDEIEVIG